MNRQLPALEGLAQVLPHAQASHGRFAHVGGVDGAAALPEHLGGVHRHVRVAQRLLGAALGPVGECDPHAGGWRDRLPVKEQRFANSPEKSANGGVDCLSTAAVEQQREFVATEPCGSVRRGQLSLDRPGTSDPRP